MAQACDVSGAMGDVFAVANAGGPRIDWEVKRVEGAGDESDHFARPQLSLTFALDGSGVMSGPVTAHIMVTTYSDKDVGQAPLMSAMRIRVLADGAVVRDSRGDEPGAEIALAKVLKAAWPKKLDIAVVGASGGVEASSTFDLSGRAEVQTLATKMRSACFR